MTSSENVSNGKEEVSMEVLFPERVWAVISSSASFAGIWSIVDLVVSEVNLKKIAGLIVRHVQIRAQI